MKPDAKILLAPGPVDIPACRWAALESLHHRSGRFRKLVMETSRMLGDLAGSKHPAWLFTASGTGAMESAIANIASPGSRVLAVSSGKFGLRWKDISDAYGLDTELLDFRPGERVDPQKVIDLASESSPDILTLTHVESSTGSLLELAAVLEGLKGPRPLVIVDAVASLGSEEIRMDDWGIDLLVGAGQKALAAPPGISFAIAGDRARKAMAENAAQPFYFSYRLAEKGMERGDTPFTPAVQAVQILHMSLEAIMEEGREEVLERHRASASAVITAAGHLGLSCYCQVPSSSVIALRLPECAAGRPILQEMEKKRGLILAGGQGDLSGKIIRTGFLGLYGGDVIRSLIEGLADEMEEAGCRIDIERAYGICSSVFSQKPIFCHP